MKRNNYHFIWLVALVLATLNACGANGGVQSKTTEYGSGTSRYQSARDLDSTSLTEIDPYKLRSLLRVNHSISWEHVQSKFTQILGHLDEIERDPATLTNAFQHTDKPSLSILETNPEQGHLDLLGKFTSGLEDYFKKYFTAKQEQSPESALAPLAATDNSQLFQMIEDLSNLEQENSELDMGRQEMEKVVSYLEDRWGGEGSPLWGLSLMLAQLMPIHDLFTHKAILDRDSREIRKLEADLNFYADLLAVKSEPVREEPGILDWVRPQEWVWSAAASVSSMVAADSEFASYAQTKATASYSKEFLREKVQEIANQLYERRSSVDIRFTVFKDNLGSMLDLNISNGQYVMLGYGVTGIDEIETLTVSINSMAYLSDLKKDIDNAYSNPSTQKRLHTKYVKHSLVLIEQMMFQHVQTLKLIRNIFMPALKNYSQYYIKRHVDDITWQIKALDSKFKAKITNLDDTIAHVEKSDDWDWKKQRKIHSAQETKLLAQSEFAETLARYKKTLENWTRLQNSSFVYSVILRAKYQNILVNLVRCYLLYFQPTRIAYNARDLTYDDFLGHAPKIFKDFRNLIAIGIPPFVNEKLDQKATVKDIKLISSYLNQQANAILNGESEKYESDHLDPIVQPKTVD